MRGTQNLRREETKIRRHKLKKTKKEGGGADLGGSCGEHPTHTPPVYSVTHFKWRCNFAFSCRAGCSGNRGNSAVLFKWPDIFRPWLKVPLNCGRLLKKKGTAELIYKQKPLLHFVWAQLICTLNQRRAGHCPSQSDHFFPLWNTSEIPFIGGINEDRQWLWKTMKKYSMVIRINFYQ